MPTVLRIGPYEFFFWLAANHGFRLHELNRVQHLVVENEQFLKEQWDAHFSG